MIASALKGMTDMMHAMAGEFRSASAAVSVPPERRGMTQKEREDSYRTETISVPAESRPKSTHTPRQRSPPPRQQTSESEEDDSRESGECDEEEESDSDSPPARGRESAKRQVEREVPTPAADLHRLTDRLTNVQRRNRLFLLNRTMTYSICRIKAIMTQKGNRSLVTRFPTLPPKGHLAALSSRKSSRRSCPLTPPIGRCPQGQYPAHQTMSPRIAL
jgi:hypothetical protein